MDLRAPARFAPPRALGSGHTTADERPSKSGLKIRSLANLKRAAAVTVVLLLPTFSFAHHALQAEFEVNKPSRRWTGTLKSVQWVNPHSHFTLDVADDNGKVTTWNFETASPNGLRRAGFSKETSFELGKTYTVIGYAARNGATLAFVEQLTLPGGRTVRIWFGDPNGSN